MPEVRCPKHDVVFQTETDHAFPGKVKKGRGDDPDTLEHPENCHPDCPVGKAERGENEKKSRKAAAAANGDKK